MKRTYTPYQPSEREYPELSPALKRQLGDIEPSVHSNVRYYPCKVELASGKSIDRVYVAAAQQFIDIWGVWPDEDTGKVEISLEVVVAIRSSPSRLPAHLTEKLYATGESGVDYFVFTAQFSDGSTEAYITGNLIDFIAPPRGKSCSDIVDVKPHSGRGSAKSTNSVNYYWCLHGKGVPQEFK